jgi:hypothetical protein
VSTAALMIACFAAGIAAAWYADRNPAFGMWWFGSWAIVCAVLAVLGALQRDLTGAVVSAVFAVLNGLWANRYRKRRKRRGKLATMGAKSRARLAALVARQRAAQRRTRPVLRPAPGGAR